MRFVASRWLAARCFRAIPPIRCRRTAGLHKFLLVGYALLPRHLRRLSQSPHRPLLRKEITARLILRIKRSPGGGLTRGCFRGLAWNRAWKARLPPRCDMAEESREPSLRSGHNFFAFSLPQIARISESFANFG